MNDDLIKCQHFQSPGNKYGTQDMWGVLGGGGRTCWEVCQEGGVGLIHVRLAGQGT